MPYKIVSTGTWNKVLRCISRGMIRWRRGWELQVFQSSIFAPKTTFLSFFASYQRTILSIGQVRLLAYFKNENNYFSKESLACPSRSLCQLKKKKARNMYSSYLPPLKVIIDCSNSMPHNNLITARNLNVEHRSTHVTKLLINTSWLNVWKWASLDTCHLFKRVLNAHVLHTYCRERNAIAI